VIAVRYPTVPKVTALLTIQSGLAVDPADKAGLAQLVADAAQEGTATRSSEQIKRDVFAIGAALTGTAGQDAATFQIRGLIESLPQMLALVADVVRNPKFPVSELDRLKADMSRNLAKRTRHFNTGRTPADDHECEQPPLIHRVAFAFGLFEGE